MTRASLSLLTVGTALFVALLAWQGFGAVAGVLAAAGWGLVGVVAFHLVPLVIDAWAIAVTLPAARSRLAVGTIVARWVGESVNSLLPAGQLGGPVMMVRQLTRRGVALPDAVAAIAVSTTTQVAAQIVFALLGIAVFAASAAHGVIGGTLVATLATTVAVLVLVTVGFYAVQRRGLFGRLSRFASRCGSKMFARQDWPGLTARADAIDVAVVALYRDPRRVGAAFALGLVAWIVGTGEVWLALHALGHPVGWRDALLLESVGQAIRGAAFAIPGSLGAQEGGFLLLAPLVGLPLDVALALSLVKRVRELALGVPGLVALQSRERRWRSRPPVTVAE